MPSATCSFVVRLFSEPLANRHSFATSPDKTCVHSPFVLAVLPAFPDRAGITLFPASTAGTGRNVTGGGTSASLVRGPKASQREPSRFPSSRASLLAVAPSVMGLGAIAGRLATTLVGMCLSVRRKLATSQAISRRERPTTAGPVASATAGRRPIVSRPILLTDATERVELRAT